MLNINYMTLTILPRSLHAPSGIFFRSVDGGAERARERLEGRLDDVVCVGAADLGHSEVRV